MEFSVLPVLKAIGAAPVILLLPGWALLAWRPAPAQDFLEWLAEAVGLSIALTAWGALLFQTLGWPATGPGLWSLYGGLGLCGLAGRWFHRGIRSYGPGRWPWPAALAALIAWRFYQVHDLAFPPWVDAPHHVLIIRKILETGGLPVDLNPYLDIPFYYHFGFHVLTALFAGFSGAPLEKAALWMGQLLNALVSLSLYYLGKKIWKDPARAGLAALLSACVSQMPAYYATWGRYSLLCGLVLLPLAMGAAWEAQREDRPQFAGGSLALLTAGTALAHYFAAGLLGLFALVFLSAGTWGVRRRKRPWRETIGKPLAGFAAGTVLVLPWLLRLWKPAQPYGTVRFITPSRPLAETYFSDYGTYLVTLLGPVRNYLLILLAVLGLIWAWRESRTVVLACWGLLLGLGVIPWGIHLFPFRPDHLAIVLFLPVSLLAAHFAGEALSRIKQKTPSPLPERIGLTLLLALVIWGLQETRCIVKPETVLAGSDDRRALAWIAENTPAPARFLVRPTPWEWGLYRGLDGGCWITPLTGRWSSLPPVLYGFGSRELIRQINQRAEKTLPLQDCGSAFWELTRDLGITHIYTREGEGPLPPETLAGCPGLELAHRAGRVYLFKIP